MRTPSSNVFLLVQYEKVLHLLAALREINALILSEVSITVIRELRQIATYFRAR